ncbi:hypothetical protein GCM10011495_34620 [Hymenobacter frigidus]|uniref:Curlin associated repeat-containing protein n=1 Tax=Hymenobacter frigidus TaxID=1524095 RepID=A0ABQ2ACL1_9BACT|nr:hypothetical protein [Hymenobacter frigidus]GGH89920.1 hypothetical protein GCM10011495_34620 [Hymenobacter frigidus]
MKTLNTAFLLLAAATFTVGTASAQVRVSSGVANAKPAAQSNGFTLRNIPPVNLQLAPTARTEGRIDHDSYVSQLGADNFARVDQTGNNQSANMIQVNPDQATLFGNDGYQRQSNGTGTIGENAAYMVQSGKDNYADQAQAGNRNVAIVEQGGMGAGGARNSNYSVQCQTGSENYGYVDQDSNGNFAQQEQVSSISSSIGGGLNPGSASNGNFADTRQGNGFQAGSNGSDAQWSQVFQNGQNNRAMVRQDHD